MDLSLILIFILVGALAGTLAGLMGLGGGVLYVPVLIYSLAPSLSPKDVPLVAVSTSLAVITVSLLASAYTHYKNGNVHLRPLPGLVFGGTLGAIIASLGLKGVDAHQFKVLLGLFELFIAIQLIRGARKNEPPAKTSRHSTFAAIGFLGGLLSAFFGVGGGLVVMPLMHFFAGYPLKRAVGVASIYMILATIVGLVSHSLQIQVTSDFPGLWKSFYLPGLFALLPSAFLFNRVGALLVNRVNPTRLKQGFGFTMLPIAGANIIIGLLSLL